MTVLTDTQVITASGGLVELGYLQITSAVSVTATSVNTPTTVISPITVVCDGSPILVEFFAPYVACGSSSSSYLLLNLTQDGTAVGRVATNFGATAGNVAHPVHIQRRITPSAGTHTFGVVGWYTVSAGSVGAGDASTADANVPAFLRVSKIVQATQWPAVTRGTIICTSSTRPASPFVGQKIYEADTSRYWTYSTWSQWVPDDMVFATEAARDTAIPSANATEGMRAYITGSTVAAATGEFTAVPTGIQTIYNGSSWVSITPVGSRTSNTGTTTSTSYTATLSGSPGTNPSVTLTTGTTALVSIATHMNNSAGNQSCMSFAVSGATTVAASDAWDVEATTSAAYSTVCRTFIFTALTAGTNTFTLQYRAGANTNQVAHRCITVQGIA